MTRPKAEPMPRSERAQVALRARWGPRRVVRLDDLPPPYHRVVLAMIDAAKAAAASEPDKV